MRRSLRYFLALACLSTTVVAQGIPHTWHTVNAYDGTWQATLQMINEKGSFVTRDNTPLTTFTIRPGQPQEYGFIFDSTADFDIAYTLTLAQASPNNPKTFSSKACVFVITAAGPAQPDVRVSSFNGAICDWKVVHGVGEDFFVA